MSLRPLVPVRASFWRALAEGLGGYLVLLAAAWAVNGFRGSAANPVAPIVMALGWVWLSLWPALAMRVVEGGPWWLRVFWGATRASLAAFLIAVGGWILAVGVWPKVGLPLAGLRGNGVPIALGVGFVFGRVPVVVAALLIPWAGRRLRWQLMVSHVAAVVLTFAALTAVGSVVVLAVAISQTQPDGRLMAQTARDQLLLTGNAMDPRRADRVFVAIETEKIQLRGLKGLAFLFPHLGMPQGIALFDPGGGVLAGRLVRGQAIGARTWRGIPELTPSIWARLRAGALRGAVIQFSAHLPGTASGERSIYAEAPIQGPRGRVRGFVTLLASSPQPNSQSQFFAAVIAIFGAATVALVAIAALPLLALSFLLSYVVARGLTRRLEAVSAVAGAIASGNFHARAPVTARNEVGRLADDINRMAGRLEETVTELRSARLQAEDALRSRQELMANVSHELRTPLAILHAHLESLEVRERVASGVPGSGEVPVPETTLDALRQETERLGTLIDDLFALSRTQSGGLQVERRPVDVGAVVDEVARVMRPLAEREGAITLSVDVPPGLPPALTDPDRLNQIVTNLVRNAIRHTPEGGIIALSVRRAGDRLALAVADTGEGIAPEHLPHVFERFYRADPSRTRATGGAGLGLAIVRELVELMGGEVTVESNPGEGACFRVFLPIALKG
jgi:signal transduction histidine kinase